MTAQQDNNSEQPRSQLSAASVSVKIEKVMTETEYAYFSELAKQAGFAGLKTYLLEQVDEALTALSSNRAGT